MTEAQFRKDRYECLKEAASYRGPQLSSDDLYAVCIGRVRISQEVRKRLQRVVYRDWPATVRSGVPARELARRHEEIRELLEAALGKLGGRT